jgi:glycosyltransferase involved in cell wall biosynthesis
MVSLSIVVPVYSGEKYLSLLSEEIAKIRDRWIKDAAPISLERLIFVDDAAGDKSPAIIDQLSREHSWIKSVHLSRNFGQHAATIAGILETSEDWVVTVDEDLQHPPSRIINLLRKAFSEDADLVYGKPEGRIHEAVSRDFTSRLYKRIIGWLTGNRHIRDANSFRLIRGDIARGAAAAAARDTYFDTALSWFTQRITTVSMPLKDTRFISTRKSGYRFRSLMSHGRRLLVSSQIKVLRLGAMFGVATSFLSAAIALFVLLLWIFHRQSIDGRGWTSLILVITFFSGVIVFMVGVALEYISIMLSRSNGMPLFFQVERKRDPQLADYLATKAVPSRETPKASSVQN